MTDDVTTLWREAFEGEALGEALFGELAARAGDADRRRKLELLQRLEGATRDLLRPVLEAKGIPTDGEAGAAASGRTFADAAAAQPWEDLLSSLEPSTARYAELYGRMRPLVEEDDRPVVDALLAHERALCEFARLELAGDPDPGAPILALPHVGPVAR